VCKWGAAASAPECGGTRQRAHRCGPRSSCGRRFVHERALPVAETYANAIEPSKKGSRRPRRRTPEGGGAGLAGVRVPVLWCAHKGKRSG
jgi:hypothetical protein